MKLRTAGAPAQHISAQEAAALVQSGMWLDYGGGLCQPDAFDTALGVRVPELEHLKIRSCITMRPRAVLEADAEARRVFWFSTHFSGYDRRKHDNGQAHYLPVNLGEIPDYYQRFIEPVDIVILKVCPIDSDGNFNLSAANLWHRALIARARLVIVEVCAANPHVFGDGNHIHVSEVDYVIEGDSQPTPLLPNPPTTDVDRAVARLIAGEVEDGACLQIGIGGMPNAVCSQLLESGQRELGIHTEMMTDGIADLYRAGRVTGARKQLLPGKMVCTFALGSQQLYDTMDRNPDIACMPVDFTNLPHMAMLNDNVVAINNTTQMDLQGQASSESDGHRHLTGSGGQAQFVRAGYASKGGKSFICFSSTYEKRGTRKSRIVLSLTPGNIVTATRSDMMYVVTEYGIANLKGKTVAERAKALISLAHPDFREGLERQAHEHRLIPRGVVF